MIAFTGHQKPNMKRRLAEVRITVMDHNFRFNTEATW